jgi:hypothetical protein
MKYVLAVFGVIVVFVLAIILITGNSSTQPAQTGAKKIALADYIDRDSALVFTQQGKIVGDQDYRSVRISINRIDRRVDVMQGYDNVVIKSQTFANTSAGYNTFVKALDLAGYTRQRTSKFNNEVGVCPLGNRFIYQLTVDGKDVQRTWSTSCGLQGTFGGNIVTVHSLFRSQIPGYNSFVSGVSL